VIANARFPREKRAFLGNSFSRRYFMIRYFLPVALPVRKAWGMPPCRRGRWFFVPRISIFFEFTRSQALPGNALSRRLCLHQAGQISNAGNQRAHQSLRGRA
jgi:hypothetical protein